MTRGRTVAVGALVVVVVLAGVVWFGQRSLMYVPDRSVPPHAADVLPGLRDVVVVTDDGMDLGVWYAPPEDACGATVLVAPGNGGNRGGRVGLVEAVRSTGAGVLLLDYRGYGGNPGTPSAAGLALDVRAARSWLLDQGVPPDGLVYLGESIGTGVVTELAVEHPPAALVLRSPMTSFPAVVDALYGVPLGWVVRDRYPVERQVREVGRPVAVVLGTADTLVPPEQSRAVADAAREAGLTVVVREVEGAGHDDGGLAHGDALVGALRDVLRAAGVAGCG
ncbi:alpha/beta hydrolase [Actinotalea sp. AC32]|nr:alpha/beta hydrolase [Actinotalea sp. AC32]